MCLSPFWWCWWSQSWRRRRYAQQPSSCSGCTWRGQITKTRSVIVKNVESRAKAECYTCVPPLASAEISFFASLIAPSQQHTVSSFPRPARFRQLLVLSPRHTKKPHKSPIPTVSKCLWCCPPSANMTSRWTLNPLRGPTVNLPLNRAKVLQPPQRPAKLRDENVLAALPAAQWDTATTQERRPSRRAALRCYAAPLFARHCRTSLEGPR